MGQTALLWTSHLTSMPLRSSLCGFAVLLVACSAASAPAVQDGDIIFQTSRSSQSLAIQRATHSPYSHMGIMLYRSGRPFVLEAIATVRYTPLVEWIDRGSGGHYVVKRLRDAANVLAPPRLARLRRAAESFQGRPYDPTFEWSDNRLYCSELVWKIRPCCGCADRRPSAVTGLRFIGRGGPRANARAL